MKDYCFSGIRNKEIKTKNVSVTAQSAWKDASLTAGEFQDSRIFLLSEGSLCTNRHNCHSNNLKLPTECGIETTVKFDRTKGCSTLIVIG